MQTENRSRLFAGSCLALVVSGLTFAIRGDIVGDLGVQFRLTHEQLGWIASAAFWGFVICMLIAGQVCDRLGLGRILQLACVAHCLGVLFTIAAGGFWGLLAATLLVGFGNALVEAAANPLVATLYPSEKTKKMNLLHSWFPWGIVIGGLVAFGMTRLGLNWQSKMAIILLPTLAYGVVYFGQTFPATERIQRGIGTREMYQAALRPRFLIWMFCMLLTASTELGPNQWIPNILTTTAHFSGILVLVWINSLMAIGRTFAGQVIHRWSPLNVLIGAAALSSIGLVALSFSGSAVAALLSSTMFAVGVCYFWPTMLGIGAEWFPAGGALVLAILGAVGNLSVALVLPIMGRIYDQSGPQVALKDIAILPLALVLVFAAIAVRDRDSTIATRLEV